MWRGAVPFRIAFANANQATVPHIDGDQQFLPGLCRHRAFAQDHILRVDIIVDGRKLFLCRQSHPGQHHFQHGLAVQRRKPLSDAHIVDVILKEFSLHISQILGDKPHLPIVLQRFCRDVLIISGHFVAQMAAAGMHHQIQSIILAPIHFDKMIAAAQRANALLRAVKVYIGLAPQLIQIDFAAQFMRGGAHRPTAGDLAADQFIQLGKIQFPLFQPYGLHTAADVHAHHSGHDLIGNGHGRADGTADTRVHIRHNADFAVGKRSLVTHGADLLRRLLLQLIGITNGSVPLPNKFNHMLFHLLFLFCRCILPACLPFQADPCYTVFILT